MNLNKLWAVCVILLAQQASFSQSNPIIKYLPSDASMVISFNPVNIAKKIPAEDFRRSSLYRQMMKKNDAQINAFFTDPSSSGIDFSSDLIFTITYDTNAATPEANVAIFGLLKNEATFAKNIGKLSSENNEIHIYGTNKILSSKNGESPIGWNNEIFVISSGNKKMMQEQWSGIYNDTTTSDENASEIDFVKRMEEIQYKIQKMQRDNFFELLTPKNHNPLLSNTVFTQHLNEPGDIKIWSSGSGFNLSKYAGVMPPQAMGIFSRIQSLAGGNKASIINFEEGKISAITHNYINEAMANIYQKYPPSPLNTELTTRLPKGVLLGLMVSSINPDMAKEILQESGINQLFDSLKQKLPFNPALATTAFKNNMMLAVIKNDDPEHETTRNKLGGIELILALPIAEKDKFIQLKNSVSKLIDSLKNTEKGKKTFKDFNPAIKYNDDLFVLASSEKTATDFLNNPGSETTPEWLKSYTSYPMVMSLNIKSFATLMFGKTAGPSAEKDKENGQKIFNMFDKLIITGGNYVNGSLNSTAEFLFSNKNENAMKQLFDLVSYAVEENEKVKEERRKAYEEDVIIEKKDEEILLPPPPKPSKNVKKGNN